MVVSDGNGHGHSGRNGGRRTNGATWSLVRRRLGRQRPAGRRLLILLAFGLGFASAAWLALLLTGVGTAYAYITKDLPRPEELTTRPLAQVTRIYDRSGEHLLHEFFDERRINVKLREVAPVMVQATLAIEDQNFYAHTGFDLRGMARAVLVDLTRERVEGGSTITQQLVKATFLTPERSIERKLKELILAIRVEWIFKKEQILEMYLNQVYYGHQAYGIEAAAQAYYGKSARDLNLSEAALLAGLVQAPSRWSPYVNPSAATRRRGQVLDNMVRLDMVTQAEADAASAVPVEQMIRRDTVQTPLLAPHFVNYVKERLQRQVHPDVLRSGLVVYTTLDMVQQEKAEAAVRRRVNELRRQRVNNGALVALRPQTGEVVAWVGSYDYYNEAIDGQVNVPVMPRQPGSSFKPIVYAAAFGSGKWTPAHTLVDRPIARNAFDERGRPTVWRPKNYDDRFHGVVTLRSALANSYNIPAVLLGEAVGATEVIRVAKELGATTDLPPVLSLPLGAGGMKLADMVTIYGVFANQGVRQEPQPILRIDDRDGRTLYDLKPGPGRQVLRPGVAFLITSILSDNAARRPMFGNVLTIDRPAAVKTGTADDYRDSWTVGFTPDLAVGTWIGNTDNSPMLRVPGSLGGAFIWRDFMQAAHSGQPGKQFVAPDDVQWANVCGGYVRYNEVFLKGNVYNGPCVAPPPASQPRATPVLPPSG